jgi:hypothetical protein
MEQQKRDEANGPRLPQQSLGRRLRWKIMYNEERPCVARNGLNREGVYARVVEVR